MCWYWQCWSQLQNASVNVQKGGDKYNQRYSWRVQLHGKPVQGKQPFLFGRRLCSESCMSCRNYNPVPVQSKRKKSMAVSIREMKMKAREIDCIDAIWGSKCSCACLSEKYWMKSLKLMQHGGGETAIVRQDFHLLITSIKGAMEHPVDKLVGVASKHLDIIASVSSNMQRFVCALLKLLTNANIY